MSSFIQIATSALSNQQAINHIVARSRSVLELVEIGGREWYRKPKDGRRGPWLSAKYKVLDQALWMRRTPCIYFVKDSQASLKYVGISLNRLEDRWRTSPAYTIDDVLLDGDELFHSQCWSKICDYARAGNHEKFYVSVLSGVELIELLRPLEHKLSHLAVFSDDPEIIVTVLEMWICKHGVGLWNKALTGGKNPRAQRKTG